MIEAVRHEAERISSKILGTRWYLFGSFTRNPRGAADVDVLVVCRSHADAIRIREEIHDVCSDWPLHLLLMTDSEEEQTKFIVSEGCVLLSH